MNQTILRSVICNYYIFFTVQFVKFITGIDNSRIVFNVDGIYVLQFFFYCKIFILALDAIINMLKGQPQLFSIHTVGFCINTSWCSLKLLSAPVVTNYVAEILKKQCPVCNTGLGSLKRLTAIFPMFSSILMFTFV